MAEVSDSLKEEMSAALRGDLERARQKRDAEPSPEMTPAPEPEPQPEPERRSGLFSRFRR
jgi:hypothetical protein